MVSMLLLRLSGLLLLLLLLPAALPSEAAMLALYNRCRETVWPGIQPSAGKPVLARGGFRLLPNQAYSIRLPTAWSGRVWGRQGCTFDAATGRGRCATGDCGGNLFCSGIGGSPPATLAEMTLGQGQAQDFYDVSLVDGYNLGISMTPFRGKGSAGGGVGGGARCAAAGCVSDLNAVCPAGLAVREGGQGGRVVGCRSACSAFGSPRYCCTGSYGGPQTCKPTSYSRLFKAACPRAYSYAYDDASSILTCSPGVSYLVTFCPHR